jgi:hypothetical protein
MKMNRRDLLKLSGSTFITVLVSPFISAQTPSEGSKKASELSKPTLDGNITYNAGWVVPLEDKSALLELEAKKNKEKEDLAKQKSGSNDALTTSKDKPKKFSDKLQDALNKVKNFF